ncbi:MAG: glycosyltransferase family 4 protein [Christensenellaceae bacterium]|nr:glycosyltransferase family 4 protein [Christensenellaceae bacterium]
MKIAMFGHKRIPSREGGVEIVVSMIASRMAALGHDLICYNRGGHHIGGAAYDEKKEKEYEGIRLKTVPTLDQKGLAAVTSSFFASMASSFSRAKVVHIHAEGPAFMSFLPKLFGKKVIVTIHGLDWQREKWKNGFASKYIRAGEKMAVRFADEIIVLSRNVQQYFMETYGRKTVFIPNAVEKPEILPINAAKERFELEKEEYILFLGRLVPEKGVHYLIEAFRKIETDKKLVIAGAASDSADYEKELYKLAAGDKRILMTGFVQGEILGSLYSNAAVYVHPSDVEGMPLSLLEAMSYGNCCLVSDILELTEVTENKAAVFEKGNVDSLAEKLEFLLKDNDARQRYQNEAQAFICKKYNWDDVVKETLELYQ